VIASLVVALVVAIDQLSKQWALTTLGEVGSTVVLPGPFDLTLLFNYSSAFGLVPVTGGFTRWGLAALNLAVASILIRVVVLHTATRLSTLALAFIIAGAIGNALDRIRLGAVIDLFNASKLGFIWVFNVADVSIDIGLALLLLVTVMTRAGYDRLFILVMFRLFTSDVANADSFAPAGPVATPGAVIPKAIPATQSAIWCHRKRPCGCDRSRRLGSEAEGPEPGYVTALNAAGIETLTIDMLTARGVPSGSAAFPGNGGDDRRPRTVRDTLALAATTLGLVSAAMVADAEMGRSDSRGGAPALRNLSSTPAATTSASPQTSRSAADPPRPRVSGVPTPPAPAAPAPASQVAVPLTELAPIAPLSSSAAVTVALAQA
jgi:signal peptidase II